MQYGNVAGERKYRKTALILHQTSLGVPMVFDGQPPGLAPIILDILDTERLGAVAGLPHFVQNLEWDLQFTGRHIPGLAGLPKDHYQGPAVNMSDQTPGDGDRIADTAASIHGGAITVTL
jgi:hypothetical protein